ncbi:hypothetical protein L596_020048 [Steinernema carpocapsae]|uniref:Uncharacterized protein n=1 Tax=Steinernema carpocapsae TaxID=34508 RepID=A0A4U5MSF9_STECR|nr:hypothetical protein L596_020048 [Steinernema carpocapsae]
METLDALFYEAVLSRMTFDFISIIDHPFLRPHAQRYLQLRRRLAVTVDPSGQYFEGCRLNWHVESFIRSDFIRTPMIPAEFQQELLYPGTRVAVVITPGCPNPGNELDKEQTIPMLGLAPDVHIIQMGSRNTSSSESLFSSLSRSTTVRCITTHRSYLDGYVSLYLKACFLKPSLKTIAFFGGCATSNTITDIEHFLTYGNWRYACISHLMISRGHFRRIYVVSVDVLYGIISTFFQLSVSHSVLRLPYTAGQALFANYPPHEISDNACMYLSPDVDDGDTRSVCVVLETETVMLFFHK